MDCLFFLFILEEGLTFLVFLRVLSGVALLSFGETLRLFSVLRLGRLDRPILFRSDLCSGLWVKPSPTDSSPFLADIPIASFERFCICFVRSRNWALRAARSSLIESSFLAFERASLSVGEDYSELDASSSDSITLRLILPIAALGLIALFGSA